MTTVQYQQRTRAAADFYALMGPLFGSRAIAKELGMPMYDDPGRIWVIAVVEGHAIGCGSVTITGRAATFKSAWVAPAYRGQGVYDQIFQRRLAIAAAQGARAVTATATSLSRNTHLRYGFREIGRRGKYFVLRKDLFDVV